MATGRIIEGCWDCKYCGSDKIRGSIDICPNCGSPRDKDTRFYMDNPKNYVSEDVAKTINKNPDWLCPYCDSLNSDDINICNSCGSPREDSKDDYFSNKEKKAMTENSEEKMDHLAKKSEALEEKNEEIKNLLLNITENSQTPVNTKKSSVNIKKILSIICAVVLVIGSVIGLTWLLMPKTQTVTIDSVSWERTIDVEEYKTVEESDWSVPTGGRVQYTQQEIQSYRQVLDHYETKTRQVSYEVLDHYEDYVSGYRDLGNGYFEEIMAQRPVYRTEYRTETYEEPVYRSEPVYATKYYYEIDKWVHKEYVKTTGTDKNPVWGTYNYKDNEREGPKTEKYMINVINKKEKISEYKMEYEEWITLNPGDTINIKTYITGKAELLV